MKSIIDGLTKRPVVSFPAGDVRCLSVRVRGCRPGHGAGCEDAAQQPAAGACGGVHGSDWLHGHEANHWSLVSCRSAARRWHCPRGGGGARVRFRIRDSVCGPPSARRKGIARADRAAAVKTNPRLITTPPKYHSSPCVYKYRNEFPYGAKILNSKFRKNLKNKCYLFPGRHRSSEFPCPNGQRGLPGA